MADQTLPADQPTESVCPWCSAALVPDKATCASCGAIVESGEDRDVPGLTAVDTAILRGEKKPPSRSRLLSWISGEYNADAVPSASEASALAPPDPAVQREIIRLELEAEVANLQAEADSLLSEAVVEGRVAELPQDVQEMATGEFDAETLAAAQASGDAPTAPVVAAPVTASGETASDDESAADDDEVPPA
jgi:hypothetical protein